MTQTPPAPEPRSRNFIEEIMEADLADDKHGGRICTRFPPEPNGYLHIGHAKSICINFGHARKYGGSTNLRFDDTNPAKEDVEYVDSIREDVRWLGFEWAGEHYASDYFQFLYDYAEYLVETGKAYVCDLSDEEIREYRGNFFKAGPAQPLPRPPGGREPRPVPAHARRRIRGRRPGAAGQDRRVQPQHEPARSADVPHQAGAAPPHRARLADLPHVRLRPRRVRRHRADHPLHLHPGIRGPPATLRLVPGAGRGRPLLPAPAAAADRVRPAQPHLHRHEQAPPAGTGEGRPRARLGRPAHAHHHRPAPARLHAGEHPGLRRQGGRGQARHGGRRGPAGALRARGPGRQGQAGHGRAAAAEAGDRQHGRRRGALAGRGQPPRRRRPGPPAGAVRPGAVHRAGGLPGSAAQEVVPAGPGGRGAAEERLPGALHLRREGCLGRGGGTALPAGTRPPWEATPPTGAR